MNFPHDQVVFLLEVLPPKARNHLPFLETIGKEAVGAIEISGGVADRILEVLETIPPASIPVPRRDWFRQLVNVLREDKSNREASGAQEEKSPALQELDKALAGKTFSSEEEFRSFMDSWNDAKNDRCQPDLGHLTPRQLHLLFQNGWWSPKGPVRLATELLPDEVATVPLVKNLRLLLSRLVEHTKSGKVKGTATGNLPASIIAVLLPNLQDPLDSDLSWAQKKKRVNENDLHSFKVQREFAQTAGLISLNRGYWSVTPAGQKYLNPREAGGLPCFLFNYMFHGFDLSRMDRREPVPEFMQVLPYSLWRISRLPVDQSFSATDLSNEVLHPQILQNFSMPFFSGSKTRTADFLARHRLFNPLVLLGCLALKVGRGLSEPETFRVTPLFRKLFQAPGFPEFSGNDSTILGEGCP